MALSILDGNQSATTLSTILSSGQHITAHTVVSLGTQAITDMRGAVSGSVVSVSSLPAISGTVTAQTDFDVNSGLPCVAVAFDSIGGVQRVGTTNAFPIRPMQDGAGNTIPLAISGTVTIGSALPTGTNRIGVVTIGAGTVTIEAGTAQIGSVTASISNFPATQAISIASVTIGNSITIGSLPALVAGTAQIGSVTASISNSVVTFYPLQGTAVSNTNFTSTTASTTLASAVAGREVLTVFSEGPGNLFISSGATCTTISYQVRLSSGDYWECPQGQLSLLHTAVFSASSSTARVCQVS